MTNIISIGTATPAWCHSQQDILGFMQQLYQLPAEEQRKLAFLYKHSGIDQRYSVIADYGLPREQWQFLPKQPGEAFPLLEERMQLYQQHALPLSLQAVEGCLKGHLAPENITHLVTVSCTGMSAPGLDIQVAEALQLPGNTFRTSVNFMGCYAAIHALKLAHLICAGNEPANVLIVDTELCTLHFQQAYTPDNAASSLLFADGSAAVLLSNTTPRGRHVAIQDFYSLVATRGKQDMAWELSSKGFLMTLSGYIPQLIQQDIVPLVQQALAHSQLPREAVINWCIHPGGKKILDVIERQLQLPEDALCFSRRVLQQYGNLSSPTILFVLKDMLQSAARGPVFGAAFGPGLTMETFTGKLI
ncbi:type III polyketide synthase [Deminuibacter soli]|uniref:Type III polyketide synthase n=1 Tax=Deminuibacter soli TaxID=2291815 RepID=A0A3E1NPK3_9BACT|nr:type III polyketide synthase [Deminuibacter soli]RFM29843.1 type III polyketide synthase [Deminuibacter soli]